MHRKRIAAGVIVLLIIVSVATVILVNNDNRIVLKGEVEAPVFSNYARIAGEIIELPVELGQSVRAGDLIAVIDSSDAEYALEQIEAVLAKKQAILSQLEEGADSLEIKQAKNNVEIAQSNYAAKSILYDRALSDYENSKDLFDAGAATQNDLNLANDQKDLAKNNLEAARTQLDNSRQSLNLLLEGAGEQEIIAARSDVEQTDSQVRQMKANLEKYRIKAVADGVIISMNYRLGDMVNVGYNLIEISSQTEKYLVAYVPEDDIYNIEYGQVLNIGFNGTEIDGTVCYLDSKAQYTPKDMQTSANKNKDSIKIKLRLPADTVLKPGEKAEVLIDKK